MHCLLCHRSSGTIAAAVTTVQPVRSVDGINVRIPEPTPFNPGWFSHKFHGPGLRCEVAISVQSCDIVWVNGPCPCGEWPDLRIAHDSLVHQGDLEEGEMMLADGGHCDGCEFFETPTGEQNEDQRMKSSVRARHETVNGNFKRWGVIEQVCHHRLHEHHIHFQAVANVTQMIPHKDPMTATFAFECDDNEEEWSAIASIFSVAIVRKQTLVDAFCQFAECHHHWEKCEELKQW